MFKENNSQTGLMGNEIISPLNDATQIHHPNYTDKLRRENVGSTNIIIRSIKVLLRLLHGTDNKYQTGNNK